MSRYELSYAGVPFVGDVSRPLERLEHSPIPPESLYERINRLLPFDRLQELYNSTEFTGRNTCHLARPVGVDPRPEDRTKIGEWFYPVGASRHSVFRGLATSSQAKAMLKASLSGPQTFVMKCVPDSPSPSKLGYSLSTRMRLLPPRPLAEHGGGFDGVYLITLVDERYDWRTTPWTPDFTGGWAGMIESLGDTLGVQITHSAIESVYGSPEPDSQLWADHEDSGVLFDAVAGNVGRSVVRRLDGSYVLLTPAESAAVVASDRKSSSTRLAGGSLFTSGRGLMIGDLNPAKNLVCPETVRVTFPKYVTSDPVPHYYNPRPGDFWFQDSYGETYAVDVPSSSGGPFASGVRPYSGGVLVLHDTCKAVYDDEASAPDDPTNVSGLTSLAMRLTADYYGNQTGGVLDECYPGTLCWLTEGLHDLIWTYSDRAGVASCRVMRSEWSSLVKQFQHSLDENLPVNGGPSIAATVRDSYAPVYVVNLTTVVAPLGVREGVRTEGGVNEAMIRVGTDGSPGGGGGNPGTGVGVPGPGYGGVIYYDGTVFNYQGAGYGLSQNVLNFLGSNTLNFYSPGASSGVTLSGLTTNSTFNVQGTSLSAFVFNFQGGSVLNFGSGSQTFYQAGSTNVYQAGSTTIFDVSDGATFFLNTYPSDGTSGVGCPRFFTYYQHMQNVSLSRGQVLQPGQKIGELTAIDVGAHLHFALGDSYTPFGQPGGTNSYVGNTVNLNANDRWFPVIGQRAAGGGGPSAPNFTAAQIAWIFARLRRPVDPQFFWVDHRGSSYHVGKDYYAVDVHTEPQIDNQQDVGKSVYHLVNSPDVTTRVVFVGLFGNGYGVCLQHDKNTDNCNPGALVPALTPLQPPCNSYNPSTWVFASDFLFSSVDLVTLTFDTTVTAKFTGPVKFTNGWWLHYRQVDLGNDPFDTLSVLLELPQYPVAHRVVLKVTWDTGAPATVAGLEATPDSGAGQVIWLINDESADDLVLIHVSGAVDPEDRILCPGGTDLTLTPYSGAVLWYDPDLEKWRVIGFCCGGGSGTDQLVKISSGDTTAGFLEDKLKAGSGIVLTKENALGNEDLKISWSGSPLTTKGDLWGCNSTIQNARVPVGSSGQVLTAKDDELLGVKWVAPAGGGGSIISDHTQIGASYNCTNTFAAVGGSLTLPSAGTYLISATVTGTLDSGAIGDSIQFRIQDTTAGATVGFLGAVAWIQYTPSLGDGSENNTSSVVFRYVSTGSDVIQIEAKYLTVAPPSTAQIGNAHLAYVKLA